jgi:hypothetical protein
MRDCDQSEAYRLAIEAGVADRSLMLRLMRHSSSTAREQAAAAKGLAHLVGVGVEAAMSRRQAALGRVVIEGESREIGRAAVAVAEPMLIASLPGLEHSPIPGLPDVGRQRLRELYLAWGRPADAARYR